MNTDTLGDVAGLPMDTEEQIPLGCRAMMTVYTRFYGSF